MGGVKTAVLEGRICENCATPLPASGEPQACSTACAQAIADSQYADDLESEWFAGAEAELYS